MALNKQTQRQYNVDLVANVLYEFKPNTVKNEYPTVIKIQNGGIASVNVGIASNLTTSANGIMQIAGGGTSVLSDPMSYPVLYFISSGDCTLTIVTWIDPEVKSSDLYQTQATVIINSTVTTSVNLGSALPAGDNNIGNVDIASPLPAGANTIGNVGFAGALPAGDNNIGNVDIASAIPAGGNTIGNVGLIAGVNTIGKVNLNAGDENIGNVDVVTMPNVPTAVPTIYNTTMTNADTEYSQALTGVHKLAVNVRGGVADNSFRLAFVTGKVATPTAPYLSIPANQQYLLDNVNIANMTIYIAGSVAGMIVEIEVI